MSKFDINGAIIEFDEKMDNYNSIRKLFKEQAISLSNEFKNKSLNEYNSLKKIRENCLSLGLYFIEEAIKIGVETLINYGVITIDTKTFEENFCKKYLIYEKIFNNLNKDILSGFKNKRQNNIKSNDIDFIINKLKESLYQDIFNIHFAIVDALKVNNIESAKSSISKETIKKSEALFNNYKDGFIDTLDEYNAVKYIISFNPYREDIYKFFIKEDGDFNKEIDRLTKFLGIDIDGYKERLMDEYIKNLLENKSLNLELDKERVKKYAMYIGCEEIGKYTARVDAIYMFEKI